MKIPLQSTLPGMVRFFSGLDPELPMKKNESTSEFVVCINNEGYPPSLELHKIYRVVLDKDAAGDEDLRIIDESGEDYLYPASYFALIKAPDTL